MSFQHQNLAGGKWDDMNLMEQLANVGSEVERAIKWKEKNNPQYCQMAFERALELLDLTISDAKNLSRLKEITRVRELLGDYFAANNSFSSSDNQWRKYFYSFNYAARLNH
jgi:hypothetical protein